MSKALVFVLALVAGASAYVEFPGRCANLTVVDPFNATEYLGTWFEIEKYNQTQSANGDCISATYSLGANGTVNVLNSLIDHTSREPRSANGTARFTDGTAAKLAVSISNGGTDVPYWVLDTDYVSYSIVWSCRNNEGINSNYQTVYFLSRVRNPTFQRRVYVRDYLAKVGITTEYLVETIQVDCPRV